MELILIKMGIAFVIAAIFLYMGYRFANATEDENNKHEVANTVMAVASFLLGGAFAIIFVVLSCKFFF